ncbi:MAG: universal stress protein, partial [Anaerolineae bacterium]
MTDHILVPLDGSGVAEAALAHAAALAKLLGARITLARVPETMIVPVADGGAWLTQTMESDEARRRADEYLRAVARQPTLHGLAVDCVTPAYPVVAGLFSAVEELGVDLVIMTSHGHTGAARWVFGGVAHKMVRGSPVPVYVLRAPRRDDGEGHAPPPPPPAFKTIVVPLDGSQLAESAL